MGKGGFQIQQCFTFDHRRLWCMHQASCPRLRFKIELSGPLVDELFRTTDGLGHPVRKLWGKAQPLSNMRNDMQYFMETVHDVEVFSDYLSQVTDTMHDTMRQSARGFES